MKHPNCTHPEYIVTVGGQISPDGMREIRETLQRRLDDGEDIRVIVSNFREADLKVIECSWCRNPDASIAAGEKAA